MSKTYDNYLRARERAEQIAKEKIDHLNNLALQKVKHQKLAEKAIRKDDAEKKDKNAMN